MPSRESSTETYVRCLINRFLRSEHAEIMNPQNDVEFVNFSARACWKARFSRVNTLSYRLTKGDL